MKFVVSILLGLVLMLPGSAWAEEPQQPLVADGVVIAQLQTGGAGTASEEFVLLFNPTAEDIIVTDWCIQYSSAADNVGFTSCLEPPEDTTDLLLSPGGFASFATTSFINANPNFLPDITFSGGMSGSSGHVRLQDEAQTEIDKVGWGMAINPEENAAVAHEAGHVLSRDLTIEQLDTDNNSDDFSSQPIKQTITSGLYEQERLIDLCSNIDGVQVVFPDGLLADEVGDCFADVCLNIAGLQIVIPEGYEKVSGENDCTLIPLEDAALFITELLPNAPGVDTGQEFIELYNPHSETVSLVGYTIQVGPSFIKEFIFTNGQLTPNAYQVFSDTETGITLPNSNGVQLRLIAPAGNMVSQTTIYSNAADDESWALVDDQWIFTNQITPAAANKPFLISAVNEVAGITSVLVPCPAGKFRNPATNRCKNIEGAASQLVPCDADEFRNPDTNRCNKISSSSSSLGPCPEGQERNPETNRCRKTVVLAASDGNLPTVTDISVQNTTGQINWRVIFVALLGTFGYMAYEWRQEIFKRLKYLI